MAEAFFGTQPSPGEIEERLEGFPSWIKVDLDCVGFNLEQIRRRVGVEVLPCVKTNAYGHGIVPVVAYLMRRGVERVLVAKLWEALQLREAGLNCGVINMDPLFTEEQRETVVERGITQTVFSGAAAGELSGSARRLGRTAEVFIKVDTGLGRVGVRHEEAADLIEHISSLPGVRVGGVFSTFAEDGHHDRVQLERMMALDEELRRRGVDPGTRSMASSHAILHLPEAYLDAVRPGLTLYGVFPEEGDREAGLELRQALSFKARLEHAKRLEAGESVTYGRRFVAPRRMRAGTAHVGYSDGYPRGLTNRGRVSVGGGFRPVLGTVSVNHFVVDITGTDARAGDIVEVVGRRGENTVSRLAGLAGITAYGLVVGLSPLTPRVYYEGGRPVALSELLLVER
ncbi:MAG: alanine racemase [Candidatus Bathyarchaeota archaeon]|nr:alanine racemase [Candidatus Bathyarchaeota archaeon]